MQLGAFGFGVNLTAANTAAVRVSVNVAVKNVLFSASTEQFVVVQSNRFVVLTAVFIVRAARMRVARDITLLRARQVYGTCNTN